MPDDESEAKRLAREALAKSQKADDDALKADLDAIGGRSGGAADLAAASNRPEVAPANTFGMGAGRAPGGTTVTGAPALTPTELAQLGAQQKATSLPLAQSGAVDAAPMQLAQPQGYFRPGQGWVPAQRSVQQGIGGPHMEAAQTAYQSAAGHGAQAVDLEEQAARQEAQAAQLRGAVTANYNYGAYQQQQAINQRRREAYNQTRSELDAAKAAVASAAAPPEEKSAGGKVLSAIAVGLGALGAGMTGTQNFALQVVQQKIDQEARERAAKLAAARAKLEDVRATSKDKLAMFDAQEQDVERERVLGIQRALGEIDTMASKDPAIAANAAKMREALLTRQGDIEHGLAKDASDKVTVAEHFDRGGWVGGGGGAPKKVTQDANVVKLPDGRAVRFPTEKEATEARAKITAAYNTVSMYDQALTLRKDLAKINPITSPLAWKNTHDQLNALAERILPEWSLSHGQGQVKEEEARRYKENLFPFADNVLLNTDRAKGIIEQGKAKEVEQLNNLVRGSSGEFVDAGYARDASGRLQQDVALQGNAPTGKRIADPEGFKEK